ncbi:hypothetical protein BA894_10645 [Vibrio natriegens]|uniref:hypothetical protein n=1 Tax=Vibrio natriegens TaxID=691 RepID=UPI00080473BD|nr:hypothetical protein [Vibrio natriegens]ANQ26883.1 hypothetical protein BA894_10645 [Vibrio natriegens]
MSSLLKFVLPLILPLSVNAMQHLEAKHRILFEDAVEPGKRWVYEIEISNQSDSPLDQLELALPDADSTPPFESPTIFVESLEANSTFVVHWRQVAADLTSDQQQQAMKPVFFTGNAVDAQGESIDVEMMSHPDMEWLDMVSIKELSHD